MGRCDEHFSDEQRRVMADSLLAGDSAAEVVAAAAAGELDGLPAFKVSETTVRDIGREARHEAERNPRRLAVIADKVVTMTETELERLEKIPDREKGNQDLTRIKRLVQLSEVAVRAEKETKRPVSRPTRRPPPAPENGGDTAQSLLPKLLGQTEVDPE